MKRGIQRFTKQYSEEKVHIVFCAVDGKKCCSVCEKVFTSWLPLQDGQSRAARRGICILASSFLVLVFVFSSILVLAFVLVFLFVFVDQSQGIAGLQKGVSAFWHTPSLLLSLSLFSSSSLLVTGSTKEFLHSGFLLHSRHQLGRSNHSFDPGEKSLLSSVTRRCN